MSWIIIGILILSLFLSFMIAKIDQATHMINEAEKDICRIEKIEDM